MSTENVMPSIADVAAQFAGKSIMAPSLTKEGAITEAPPEVPETPTEAPAEPLTTPEAGPVTVSENADPATAAVPDVPVEKTDPVSAKFAALSKREKTAREAEQRAQLTIKQAEDRVKTMLADAEARMKAVEGRETALKTAKRPLDILKAHGFGYEDATSDVLGGYKPPEADPFEEKLRPIQEKLSEIDKIKAELAQERQALASEKQQQAEYTVNNTIKSTIANDSDRYEFLSKFGDQAVDMVRETMIQYWQKHSTPLSYDAACDQVEEYWEETSKKLQDTKKLQARTTAAAKTPQATPTTVSTPPSSKTLTGAMTASSTATIDVDKLSPRDALKHLAKQLKFVD